METLSLVALLIVCVAASALFSGSETGIYSLSRVRVDMDADEGRRGARIVRFLLRDESALLITILIGNTLAIELATHLGDTLLGKATPGMDLSSGARALLLTGLLAMPLFLLGEALPKELYRRRAHTTVYPTVTFILLARLLLWPLERVLRGLSALLERVSGLSQGRVTRSGGRERLIALLAEGRRHGALHERAEALAHNALKLRTLPVSHAMVPWDEVLTLNSAEDDAALRSRVAASRWTRLPVVDDQGCLQGYVHQLEVLSAGTEKPVLEHMRSLPTLAADTPVDRALLHLRGGGRRGAVVGTPDSPVGLVTLKDLVEEISGDLVGL